MKKSVALVVVALALILPSLASQANLSFSHSPHTVSPSALAEKGGAAVRSTEKITANPLGIKVVDDATDLIIKGSLPQSNMGYRMAVGDFNGDGDEDLAISAPSDSTLTQQGGAVYLFLGPLPPGGFDITIRPPDLTVYGGLEGGKIGQSLLFSDLTGDGRDELVIGAPSTIYPVSLWTTVGGAVYIIQGDDPPVYGGRIDLPAVPSAYGDTYSVQTYLGGAVVCIWGLGPQKNVYTGYDLSAGDLNGDGLADLVFSRPEASSTHILWGTFSWPSVKILTINMTEGDGLFGRALLCTDIDSDGVDDLLVGSPLYSPPGLQEAGGVFLFFGNSSLSDNTSLNDTDADVLIEGTSYKMRLGEDLSGLKVSGSRYVTLAISAPGEELNGEAVGSVYLIRGRERGYFEREQPVSQLYFLKVLGDDAEAPLERSSGFDMDGDGGDELILLRPVKKMEGVVKGELVVIYSRSIYGSGPKNRLLSSFEAYSIYGSEQYDAFGCDALLAGELVYVGAYGSDGENNSAVNSGGVYVLKTTTLRISGMNFQGLFVRDGIRYAAPYRDFHLTLELYSSTGSENISAVHVNFSESEGWYDYVEFLWTPGGDVQKIRDPYELLDVGLSGNVETTPQQITIRLRMWLSYIWPTAGNISADIYLIGAGGEGVVEKGALRIKLLKDVEWRYTQMYVYSGGRNVSMDGIYLLPSSPLTFQGPDIIYRELPEVPVDLRYFRAVLRTPDTSPLTSTLFEGFTISTSAPSQSSPPEGYTYSAELMWTGPAPPPGTEGISIPPMPPPLIRKIRVAGDEPAPPVNLTIEGEWGGGKVAYSRLGDFTLSWEERWFEPEGASSPIAAVKVRAAGTSYTQELCPGEAGGLSAIFYNSSDFSGEFIYLKEVTLPARWGVLGPDPGIIDPVEFSGIFYGSLFADETGTYTVGLSSDTLAILDLDGKTLVVSEGGAKRTTMISLSRGSHPVRIWYLHRIGGECFVDLYFYPSYRPEEPARPEVQMHPPVEAELELDPGVWDVTVWGVDLLGVEGTSLGVTAVVDRTPPSIARLPGPSWYSSRPLTLQFEVRDEGAGVDPSSLQWSMSLNGVDWGEYSREGLVAEEVDGGGKRYLVNLTLSLPDGENNYVRLRVKDRVGNGYTHTGPLQIKVDTIPPRVEITSPPSGEVVRGSSVTLTVELRDTLSGLDPAKVEVYVEGEGWKGIGTDFSPGERETELRIVLTLKDGNNTFRVAVSDMAGNRAESQPLVVVRAWEPVNHPPVAVIDSPANGSRHQQGYTILFDGRSSYDDGVGPYGSLHFLWMSNISGVIGEGPVIERSLPAGVHLITLYVDDGEYNSSAHVVIEVVAPKAPPYTPSGGGGEGGFSDLEVGLLVLLGVVILILAVWFYVKYQTTPAEQAVIPIGPEEE